MHELPGLAPPHLDVPVRRALGRAGDAAGAHADGRGRGPPGRAARRRARLGQEPPRARVRRARRPATARSSSTAPATRSCARRTGRSSRRSTTSRASSTRPSCAPRSAPAGGELTRLLPDLPARVGDLPPPVEADPDTERHRLHTAVTDLLAGRQRQPPGAARARGRALGRRPDAAAPAPPGARRRRRARAPARHLPRHRGRRARRRSRRRSPTCAAPTTSSGCGSPASPATRSPSSCAAPPEATPAPGCPSSPRRSATSPTATPFLVCELWRALVETGAVEVVDGAIRLTRPLAELGTPESVREVVSQRLSRLAPATTDLLELAATAGAEFELDVVRRAAGLDEPELLAALDEAVRSGMIEELPSRRARLPVHARARAAGALRPALRACGGPSCTCASARRSRRADGRSGRALADLAHHFAAAAPLRRSARAASSTTSRAARAATAALAFDEAAARLRTALELGIESPAERAEVFLELGTREPPRRQGARRARGVQGGGGHRPRAGRRASCSRAPRSATRRRAGGPGSPTRARSSCSRRRRPRSATRAPSCASGCSAGSPARSTSRATTSAARSSRTNAIAMARRLRRPRRPRHGAGALLLVARDELARGDPRRCSPRPGTSARSWATPRSAPRRWPGACPPSSRSCDLESARREVAALLRHRRADGAAVHAPRRRALRLGDRAVRRAPRRGRGARAALARVEPAADRARRVRRLRDPDVQHPPRAGAPGRARPGDPDPRRRRRPRRARGGPGSSSLLAELGMEEEARRELARRRRRRARAVPRVALARLAHLPDRRLRGARRRGHRRARLPGARAARAART